MVAAFALSAVVFALTPATSAALCRPGKFHGRFSYGVAAGWWPLESGLPAGGGLAALVLCWTPQFTTSTYAGGAWRPLENDELNAIRLGVSVGWMVGRLHIEATGGLGVMRPWIVWYRGEPHRAKDGALGPEAGGRVTFELLRIQRVALGVLADVTVQWFEGGRATWLQGGLSLWWPI
jgi:hypothetical protein